MYDLCDMFALSEQKSCSGCQKTYQNQPKKYEERIQHMSKAKISKTELISAVADNVKESQKVVADVVNAALDVIAENLKDGVDVTIMDFGSFKVQQVQARKGRNIHTGETVTIPAHKRVKFTPGKKLSEAVSKEE